MREPSGRIVLMDLGAGLDLASDHSDRARTLTGTPMYLAPEVLSGEPASPRSDQYSLGVLLYYLVTGHYPIEADTTEEAATARPDCTRRLSGANHSSAITR